MRNVCLNLAFKQGNQQEFLDLGPSHSDLLSLGSYWDSSCYQLLAVPKPLGLRRPGQASRCLASALTWAQHGAVFGSCSLLVLNSEEHHCTMPDISHHVHLYTLCKPSQSPAWGGCMKILYKRLTMDYQIPTIPRGWYHDWSNVIEGKNSPWRS